VAYKDRLREVLEEHVREPFKDKINEYLGFLDVLFDRWWNGDEEVRGKYAYHVTLLTASSSKPLVIRAKVNSYYAYLVYRGYVTAYSLMRDKYVAGAESLYSWLRMYRAVLGKRWA
jgi:hypothetical protein